MPIFCSQLLLDKDQYHGLEFFLYPFSYPNKETEMLKRVYLSVLLYVHLKTDVLPISPPFPLYQGNTLSLTNALTYHVDFLTAYKRL